MKILLSEKFCEENKAELSKLGISPKEQWRKKSAEVDLALLKKSIIPKLLAFVQSKATPKSALALVARDIETWNAVLTTGSVKPRNCQQLAAFLTEDLRRVTGHRVFKKERDGTWFSYYVGKIRYYVPERGSPPYTSVTLYYEELGHVHSTNESFYQSDVRGTSMEILAQRGYLPETPDLRAEYIATRDRFLGIFDQVGKQFTAVGDATDDLDGNPSGDGYRQTQVIRLDMNDRPSRVVIDVFREKDTTKEPNDEQPDWSFWSKRSVNSKNAEEETEELLDDAVASDDDDAVVELDTEIKIHEVPIHPTCAVFDLRRHLRMRVHVSNLTEYVYKTDLRDSLVLPDDVRRLVDLLMVQKGNFRDIIEDKGGGAPVLCAGPPGVGKTLTAEVYSEVMERPLYSVQCSQLGLTPSDLEGELLRCFRRAQRWKAILLLDEADVYVRARGEDLKQNAIVGVFLRVIEYYGGVLFLTTNRSDKVDDAIISRCIARIDYQLPTVDEQKEIWTILARTAGINLDAATIDSIVAEHPDLSGRDIKNLLKLARMFARSERKAITVETITFARRFKPSAEQRTAKKERRA